MQQFQLNNISERLIFISPIVQGKLERELNLRDFENLGGLGQGAFGKVYKIKKQNMVQQITNEVKLMYNIDHPNIVKLYNHFEEQEYIYLVLEYAPGGQLWKMLCQINRFDEQTVKQIMRDIMSAVEYLHSLNPPIIHRDIKPENIIFDDQKRVKLADFGWSNVFNDDKRQTYCGTLEYLAPEMIQEIGHDVTLDLWSIGVLIYELLSGKAPFTPRNAKASQKEKQKELQENILALKLDFPPDFPSLAKDLVTRLLQRDTKQRLNIAQMKAHPWFQDVDQGFFEPQDIYKNPNYKPITSSQVNNVGEGIFSKSMIVDNYNKQQRDSVNSTQPSNQNSEQPQPSRSEQNGNNRELVNQLNLKLRSVQQQLNESKIAVEMKNKNIQALQQQLEQLKDQDVLGQTSGQSQVRKIQLLEEEKKTSKKDYEELWEKCKQKDEDLQNKQLELEKLKDFKQTIDRYQEEKSQLQEKLQKVQDNYNQLEEKNNQTKNQREKELMKLKMKITEMEMKGITDKSSDMDKNVIQNIPNLIQELVQKFQTTTEYLEKVENQEERIKELEKENMKFRLEKDSEISEYKLKMQEQMEDEIDKIKEQFRQEKQKLVDKYDGKIQELEAKRDQSDQEILQTKIFQDENESLKKQLELQNNIITDIKAEQELGCKLRQSLTEQIKNQDMIIKDQEHNLLKLQKKK